METQTEKKSTAGELRQIVSSWYFILRNLALLVLMLLLIYSGIKIVLESSAGEKAKYKERMLDWLVAICLVFTMHYIMVFAVELNEKFVEIIKDAVGVNRIEKVVGLGDADNQRYINASENEELKDLIKQDENGIYYIIWDTDLMGGMRIKLQEQYEGTAKWVGYALCYVILALCTCVFAWTYLKRVLYMTFLTMIAPLVAMTYPIDKITDGKAQAFDSWLKEYIFNLLIQPMHLLLYTILVSSAYELAGENALYSIVAIGFLTPAEKLIRKFFGFNKAETPGALESAAGAALAFTGLQKLMNFGKNKESKAKEEKEENESNKVRFSNADGVSAMDVMAKSSEKDIKKPINEEEREEPEGKGLAGLISHTKHKNTKSEDKKVTTPTALEIKVRKGPDELHEEIKRRKIKKPGTGRKIGKTIKSLGMAYGRELKNKALKRIKKGRPIRALARGATGLVGGAAFGMAGLALGIASGDPSKAFQYATAGAMGGYQAGKGIAGAAVDTLTVDSNQIKDEMELEWYGDEYKKAKLEQEKLELERNEEYINYIRKVTGKSREEAKETLEGTGRQCLDSGIRDIEDIVAVEEMAKKIMEEKNKKLREDLEEDDDESENKYEEEEENAEETIIDQRAIIEAIAMKKLSDRLPTDIHKMGSKKIEEHRRQFKNELKKKLIKQLQERGMEAKKAEELAERQAESKSEEMIKGIIKFADTKKQLKEIQ